MSEEKTDKSKVVEKAVYRNYSEWLNSQRYREIRKEQYRRDLNTVWSRS